MLIAVGIICSWLGWEMKQVHDRQAFLKRLQADTNVDVFFKSQAYKNIKPKYEVSWVRKMFGDESYGAIGIPHESSIAFVNRTQQLFPEAFIFRAYGSMAQQVDWLPAPVRHPYIDLFREQSQRDYLASQRADLYRRTRRYFLWTFRCFGLLLPTVALPF